MSVYSFLDIAKLCSKKSEMEMNEDFQKIQSIVNYINDYIKPINKMVFYGGNCVVSQWNRCVIKSHLNYNTFTVSFVFTGNEPYLTEIANRLKSYLKSRNYLDANGEPRIEFEQQLKRITFYLILNTDVNFKHDITKDIRICHILKSMPQITLCILIFLIWELNLDKFFFRCIAFCPSWFSLQFLSESIDSLRHAQPNEINKRMSGLLKAIYMNICRMDSYISTYDGHDDTVEKKIILNKMYDQIINLLRRYNTPDADKFVKWSKSKKDRYAGHVLYYLLDVIRRSLHWFQHKPHLEVDEVFDLVVETEKRIDNHSNTTYSSVLHENLITINTCLLNTLQNVLMTVSFDQYLYWVELDINEKDPQNQLPPLFEDNEATEYTLQYAIGTSAYRLKELINTNECLSHDVESQLNSMCIKPQTLEEKLRLAKLGDLILKLDEINNEDPIEVQKKWFNEFLSRGEFVFGNEECMETVEHCCRLFDGENIKCMLQHLESETLDTSEKQLLEKCLVNAIDILQIDETIQVVEHLLALFGPKFSFTEIEDFDNLLIGYFNKTTATNLDVKGYLKIVCQSPRLVHERIFQQLSNLTTEQVKIVVQLFQSTRNISPIFTAVYLDEYLEPASDSAPVSEANMENHILFFSELFLKNVMDTVSFMQKMTKQYLMKALMANNHQILWVNLRIMENILRGRNDLSVVSGSIPPLLVLLATCLDRTRWDILTYTQMKENCVLTIIGLVGFVVHQFVVTADENGE
jgi:hypothetical protein